VQVGAAALAELEALASSALCVSLGEAGLDYDRMFTPRPVPPARVPSECRF
jgi:Tat protein secretion system quality control protein TatD with DNase activity